jgi:hypothetical protein
VRSAIHPLGNGRFRFRLPTHDRALMAALVPQLRDVLVTTGIEDTQRLHPPAYANDPELDAEYQSLVHDELLEKRLAAIDRVEATVEADEIDEAELTAWMTTVNTVRLILGTRLDVGEDDYFPGADDPQVQDYAVYHELGDILYQIVTALSGG